MPDKWNKQGRQMTVRESEGCIVPMQLQSQWGETKPGNAGGGKASEPIRHRGALASEHSVGPGEFHDAGNERLSTFASIGGEPDAVTPHVRIWEGPRVNEARLKSCDTTPGNPWQTGNTNLNLNQRDLGLLAPRSRAGWFAS